MSHEADDPNRIRHIVIVGGGTAGWMAGACLSRLLGPAGISVTLIESDAIGTVGVGEATIPPIVTFHRMLGIDENAFLDATGGSFKLGIEFRDWARIGAHYVHAFGRYGTDMHGVSFSAFWQRLHLAGEADPLDAYSLQARAGRQGRFMHPIDNGNSPLSQITYAYHFEAGRYAAFLRRFAERHGLVRREGRIVDAVRDGGSGHIESVVLDDGSRVAGDFFIDCSGFRGLLIQQALGANHIDWSRWLPCDRAVTVPTEATKILPSLTRATARPAGWQWRIPLQHRTGHGHVFCSDHMSEDEATAMLLDGLDGTALAAPRTLSFRTGRRDRFWIGNCVALGLASGFLEPLESTGIWLIQSGLARLLNLFPDKRFDPAVADRYNRLMARDYEQVRDFLICHYHVTDRTDSEFWRRCRAMDVPHSVSEKIALFRDRGRTFRDDDELFNATSWFALLQGQDVAATGYDPMANVLTIEETRNRLAHIRSTIDICLGHMPDHRRYLEEHCTP
ncbi:tryptophan halogenase family protein [Stakelama saccharophila]|uniref:Tryptophan halogenase family protein n=1 Tax=Stakelama saccharophila TaxID=3075605 RepID=A0ABZ0B4Q9_9SPHN|nr:tryptophan halogenase family protein [Stakelama sp. W311]WNO52371.1 tryptophan halogenase family protein [Stakelama sp. W311]